MKLTVAVLKVRKYIPKAISILILVKKKFSQNSKTFYFYHLFKKKQLQHQRFLAYCYLFVEHQH